MFQGTVCEHNCMIQIKIRMIKWHNITFWRTAMILYTTKSPVTMRYCVDSIWFQMHTSAPHPHPLINSQQSQIENIFFVWNKKLIFIYKNVSRQFAVALCLVVRCILFASESSCGKLKWPDTVDINVPRFTLHPCAKIKMLSLRNSLWTSAAIKLLQDIDHHICIKHRL